MSLDPVRMGRDRLGTCYTQQDRSVVMGILVKLVARRSLTPNMKQLVTTAARKADAYTRQCYGTWTYLKLGLETGCSASHTSLTNEQFFGRCISHFFMTTLIQSYHENVKGQQFLKPQQNSYFLHSETLSLVKLLSEFRWRHIYIIAFERDFRKSGNLYTREHALTNARKSIISPFIRGGKYYL